jgi:ribosomal protein RSM22 (predicted rRNA methylase)
VNQLPEKLVQKIEELVCETGLAAVKQAARELAESYAEGTATPHLSRTHVVAYLAMRFPGTFHAIKSVIERCTEHSLPPTELSLLDVCAGPATAVIAAAFAGVRIHKAICIERQSPMVELGKELLAACDIPTAVQWICDDVGSLAFHKDISTDLVVAAYGLGEILVERRSELLDALWERTREAFILIEPGTPRGARVISSARDALLQRGASLVAPCPHAKPCALASVEDAWCHFAIRVGRTHISRIIDGASRSFEDEKFSYLIASKKANQSVYARLIGHPRLTNAGMELILCLPSGETVEVLVPKRLRDAYRVARKMAWGDKLDESFLFSLTHVKPWP